MSDGTVINAGVAGNTIRDIDRSQNPTPLPYHTQVVQLDAGGQNAEYLVSNAQPLPALMAAMGPDPTYMFMLILAELRLQTQVLMEGLNMQVDLDQRRADPSYLASNPS